MAREKSLIPNREKIKFAENGCLQKYDIRKGSISHCEAN